MNLGIRFQSQPGSHFRREHQPPLFVYACVHSALYPLADDLDGRLDHDLRFD
jgi:hypothetical protein